MQKYVCCSLVNPCPAPALLCPRQTPLPSPPPPTGVLLEDNEGALLGRVLLETTVQGARRLSARALQALGGWMGGEA